jgi:hypothetical protein
MKSDRALYEDGELVFCRTCDRPIQKPNPVRFDRDLGVHHRWCPVGRRIACDAPLREPNQNAWELCACPATFWDPEVHLCYCDDHAVGLRGLQPISEMSEKAVERIRARQLVER